jgi:hypothetical protein
VEFANVFGFAPDYVIRVRPVSTATTLWSSSSTATVVDVFGEIDVDGSGTPLGIHLMAGPTATDGTMPDGTFVIGDWTFSGPDALDGLDAAGVAAAVPFGTYVAEVTESIPICSPGKAKAWRKATLVDLPVVRRLRNRC